MVGSPNSPISGLGCSGLRNMAVGVCREGRRGCAVVLQRQTNFHCGRHSSASQSGGISVPAVGRQPVRIEIRELGCSCGAVNQTEWYRYISSWQHDSDSRQSSTLTLTLNSQPHTPTPVTVCLIAGTITKCYRLFLSIKSTSVLLCVEVAVSVWAACSISDTCRRWSDVIPLTSHMSIILNVGLQTFKFQILWRFSTGIVGLNPRECICRCPGFAM